MVRGGKYFLDETLVIGPKDGGTRESPVIYTAYPGEKPILSGGRKVVGLAAAPGEIIAARCRGPREASGNSAACLPTASTCSPPLPQPDATSPARRIGRAEAPAAADSQIAFRYKPGAFKHRWAKPSEGEVNVYYGNFGCYWGNDIIPIRSIDKAQADHHARPPHAQFRSFFLVLADAVPAGRNFVVENLLEDLERPGQWCLDSEEGNLYFWPPRGSIEGLEVVAPALIGWWPCTARASSASRLHLYGDQRRR